MDLCIELRENDKSKIEMIKNSFLKTSLGPQSVNQGATSSNSTKASTLDQMKDLLKHTPDWRSANIAYLSNEFSQLPALTMDFAKSFLLLGGIHNSKSTDFPIALSQAVSFLGVKRVPACLIPPY